VTLAPPVDLGLVDGKRRRFVGITGGTVDGPRLTGIVLPGGGDWQAIGPDGVTEIRARYTIQAADGALVDVDNPGLRVADPAVIAQLTAGERVAPDRYYFRTTPRFRVAAGPHDWLNRRVFVARGTREPAHVVIDFFDLD
jgi:hypothetical protein